MNLKVVDPVWLAGLRLYIKEIEPKKLETPYEIGRVGRPLSIQIRELWLRIFEQDFLGSRSGPLDTRQ